MFSYSFVLWRSLGQLVDVDFVSVEVDAVPRQEACVLFARFFRPRSPRLHVGAVVSLLQSVLLLLLLMLLLLLLPLSLLLLLR